MAPAGAVLGTSEGVMPAFNVSSYGNPDLGWERTLSLNTGMDLGFFENRVRLAVDAYQSTTDRLLLNVPHFQRHGLRQLPGQPGQNPEPGPGAGS